MIRITTKVEVFQGAYVRLFTCCPLPAPLGNVAVGLLTGGFKKISPRREFMLDFYEKSNFYSYFNSKREMNGNFTFIDEIGF